MKKNILVFPCGSEIGLEVYRALNKCKDFKLFGGSSTDDHGKYIYENYIDSIPFVEDNDFINKINLIINKYKIDLIIPAHDSVVLELAKNSKSINAIIVTSEYRTCDICRSKRKTYEYFKDIISVPKMYDKSEINKYPVFLKPDVGQGSKGTKKIDNEIDLNYFYKKEDQLLLQYLPNDEYTIDCFTDFNGNLKYCAGRKRNRISNGISVNAIEINDNRFLDIADKINSNIKMNGAWFFQLKEDSNNDLVLLEIAPRIAGTMEFQRAFGINLPLLSVYNSLNIDLTLTKNDYKVEMDRALSSKFKLNINYTYIYIDLDDVIILNNKVNIEIIEFLYQALNENKKVVLLSRHKQDPRITLTQYKIYDLFEEIIHITDETPKSKFIKNKDSIFIDDSNKERMDVYKNCNIPVFDVTMIDTLLK